MRPAAILSTVLLGCVSLHAAETSSAEVKKTQPSGDNDSISLFVENDYRFSDRYYTNGLKLTYTGEGDDFYTSWLQFKLLRLFTPDGTQAYQTASLGQNMYVASNISNPNPPTWDRPYAGWLYLDAGAHLATRDRLDSFTINLGWVGPQSFAQQSQKFWHSITGDEEPMGWDTQIKNEPTILLSYEQTRRLLRYDVSNNFSTDVLAGAGLDLGNVITQATARGFWRFGFNMPYSFSPTRIDYDSGNAVEWRPTDASPDWHCFMYGGGAARFVGYNITLNGNTMADSRSVVPKWLVGEGMAGISARYKMVQLDLNWTIQTAEFNTQTYQTFMFWTASVRVFF